jgi:two-component system sensor kinase FixL
MAAISPLERHIEDAREALARLASAGEANASVQGAVEEIRRHLASVSDALSEQETHLRYQQELNPQLQWIADSNKAMIAMSSQWEKLTGMSAEDAHGEGWRSVIHPDDLPHYEEIAGTSLSAGVRYEAEFRVRTAEGNYRWLRTRALPRLDDEGNLLFVYGYAEDVHEQVLGARALRESEENLRYTIELNPQLPFRADANGQVVEVSTKWMKVVGADIDKLLGLGSIDFVHPEDAQRVRDLWANAIAARQPLDSRYRLRTADGTYRWFRSQAGPRFDDQGKVVAWYGVAEDIDQQVRGQEAMAETVERYRLASSATKDIIYEWDIASGNIQWNEAITALGGPSAGGYEWWHERVHPADRDAVQRSLDRFIAEGDVDWHFDYRFRRADGTWGHIYDRAHLLRGADGSPKTLIGSMADLTDRDEAEKKVQQLRAELIHVSRLSAMGAMAATLAHELNQPLAAALNWVSAARVMVAAVPGVPPQAVEALGEGRATIHRAGEIIRRIRKLVAGGDVAREPEDLRALVDEAFGLLKAGDENTGVRFEVAVPLVRVFVDRVQIQQVLLNLMRNALDAMRESDERRLRIEAQDHGASIEIVVSDTGCGLPEGAADDLFTPFQSTKADGLGVGLSICRTIVEAHGGRIWLESVPGSGTRVHFTVLTADAEGDTAAGRERMAAS